MPSRIEYLDCTFLEDVIFGAQTIPTGTRASLQKDVARGLNNSVHINGPGDVSKALVVGTSPGGGTPVTVSGIGGVGNTLTAVLAIGWTATGFQWNRDGAPISGATGQAYTLVTADAGHLITLTVSGLVYTPTGVTIPPISVLGWDDTQTWNDSATWTD
jgi:hypothetical protein